MNYIMCMSFQSVFIQHLLIASLLTFHNCCSTWLWKLYMWMLSACWALYHLCDSEIPWTFKPQSRQPTVCCYCCFCCTSTALPGGPGPPTFGFNCMMYSNSRSTFEHLLCHRQMMEEWKCQFRYIKMSFPFTPNEWLYHVLYPDVIIMGLLR